MAAHKLETALRIRLVTSRLSLKIGFGIFLVVIPWVCTGLWVLMLAQRDLAETKFSSAEVGAQQ
jgi:hypothetical protein